MQSQCIEWQGTCNSEGYGVLYYNGAQVYAHRLVWFCNTGKWPELHVCHRCDNRRCVNIAHFFEGSDKANAHDAAMKGRMGRPNILQNEQRIVVRRMLHEGLSQRKVAKLFNTSQSTISEIKRFFHEPSQ